MNIIEFLEARIAEDEQQTTKHLPALSSHGLGDYGLRVLAECRAKRALTSLHSLTTYRTQEVCGSCGDWWDGSPIDYPCDTIKIVAAVYADRPDYQEDWALGD